MSSGIYAYWDNVKNYYVYVGKDSNIDKKTRHNTHISESAYDQQQINKVLQNNPKRYKYRVIMEGDYNEWQLNKMEKLCIKSFKTFKYDYPGRNVFNFTEGGDGSSGYKHSKEALKKMSESQTNKTLSEETKKKLRIANKGNNNPNSKYTIWNIDCVYYSKKDMFSYNGGNKPRKVFQLKYKGKCIYIGGFIDFITPEIIHDLICEAIEDYNE